MEYQNGTARACADAGDNTGSLEPHYAGAGPKGPATGAARTVRAVTLDGELGRLEFELGAAALLPAHTENVRMLCTGERVGCAYRYLGCFWEAGGAFAAGPRLRRQSLLFRARCEHKSADVQQDSGCGEERAVLAAAEPGALARRGTSVCMYISFPRVSNAFMSGGPTSILF